jgi:hypothetical protein
MCAQQKLSRINARIWRVDISRLLGELWRGAVGAAKKRNSVYNANWRSGSTSPPTGLGEERPDWRRDVASFAQEETLEIGGVAHTQIRRPPATKDVGSWTPMHSYGNVK